MAWTVADAQERAESYLDEEVEDTDAIIWANDFLREKVDSRFYPRDTEDYTDAEEDTWYALPDDFVAVIGVEDSDEEKYTSYLIDDSQIKFDDDDDYELTYRALPEELTALTDTVDVPTLFLSAMGYFIASRFRSKDDPEDQDAFVKMAECDKIVKRAMGQRRATNNPMRTQFRW